MLTHGEVPMISEYLLERLQQAFPKPNVEPGMDRDTAMYAAGAAYVVEWIMQHVPKKTIAGSV